MKICFLAPANSAHTKKWCNYFTGKNHEVHVVSFIKADIEGAAVHYVSTGARADGGDLGKLKYLSRAGKVREIVSEIAPDIINVHYATSYGTAAALAGLRDYVLSVWGSDIYDFPNRSPMHRALLKFSLKKAKHLFSTSRAMADEAAKYTDKSFEITPFGVDMNMFSPDKRYRADNEKFVVGTIKGLYRIYGIDCLIKAAAIIKNEHPEIPLELRIAGSGPDEKELKELASALGVDGITTWLGFISQEQAAIEWANMDIAAIPSLKESFGVAAVEAQASAVPVIVSDIPGLMEATKPGLSSIVVPREDERALADAIVGLFENPDKRVAMGKSGREYAEKNFEAKACFEKVENLFISYSEKVKQ